MQQMIIKLFMNFDGIKLMLMGKINISLMKIATA